MTLENELGKIMEDLAELSGKFHRLVEMLRNKHILSHGEYFALLEDY